MRDRSICVLCETRPVERPGSNISTLRCKECDEQHKRRMNMSYAWQKEHPWPEDPAGTVNN